MADTNELDHPILKLSAQEKTAYAYLFNLADTDSLGVLTGERAVSFFEKTTVPAPVLGEAWQIADTENRGLLTKPGFCMVLRLIGWYQSGQHQPTTELAFKTAPIPKFDGITIPGVSQSQPQPQAQAAASPRSSAFPQDPLQPQLSGGGGRVWVPPLDPAKVQQYSGLFDRSGAQNGVLDGVAAKNIFERAGLPNEVLGKIWMLSDSQQRGMLDQTEFIVAMHLITSMKSRTMTSLPNTLPSGLYDAAARRGQRPPSRQASTQSGVPRQLTGTGIGAPPRTQSPLARPSSSNYSPAPQPAQPTGPQWLITPQEKAQYDRFFATVDPAGKGVITGEQAVQFFSDSRLPEDTLASIWDLADINSEGQLNRDEFAVAMYLIKQQRAPNAPPLPAFLPTALIPPSMRAQQQAQQPPQPLQQQSSGFAQQPPQALQQQSSGFAQHSQQSHTPKPSDDLFGLDSAFEAPQQPTLQPQSTGASATRDPFGGNQPLSPSSPARFQPQATGGSSTFKPFQPTSAFGASLASQTTGGSATSSQGQARGVPTQKVSAPNAMDDLLGDNAASTDENSRLTNETTELANMSNQISNLRTQMEVTQNKKSTTQAELSATNNQKRDLEQRLQQFRAQYEAEIRTVKEMEQQLTASRESTKKLNQDIAMLEGTYQDLNTQHNTVSQQLQADQQENASLKQRISQMNAEVARLKPEIEKMKLDARQQKGLVSINKKQLATNEAERDRLQSEKADLEREAAERSRSAAASPEPVASPALSTLSSKNPFHRNLSNEGPSSPPPAGPTPSAFDALFGPPGAFAPSGQAESGTGTPPATSFIGRSMPGIGAAAAGAGVAVAAGAGAVAFAESKSSTGSATPPSSEQNKDSSFLETPGSNEPPPPPESRQFTPTNLPILSPVDKAESDAASSTKVMPPASRAGGVETPPSPEEEPEPSASSVGEPEHEREIIPGAFPNDEPQPTHGAREVSPSSGDAASPQAISPAPEAKPADDFESAFASFGEGEKSRDAPESNDPFAPSPSQPKALASEFPPIHDLDEDDDDSESDGEDAPAKSFDDDFTSAEPSASAVTFAQAPGPVFVEAARPALASNGSAVSDLPAIDKEESPPDYEKSDDLSHGGTGERTTSNQFPPEFGNLLPAREDPTASHQPAVSPLAEEESSSGAAAHPFDEDEITPAPPVAEQRSIPPQNLSSLQPTSLAREAVASPNTDVFVDASSRPTSSVPESAFAPMTQTAAAPASHSAFDDFDDFGDLSEAKEADHSGNDADFGFGRQSHDEFNSAFDSPAPSQTPTPMKSSTMQSQDSNGFANFTPNVSAFGEPSGNNNGSIQQTPQNVQHDWDAIFSNLDNGKPVDTSFSSPTDDPWGSGPAPAPATTAAPAPIAATNGNIAAPTPLPASSAMKVPNPSLGRAITPGTEHDDPILKRLTGMGYPRQDALNALEMYDYDINKAVDHLAGS